MPAKARETRPVSKLPWKGVDVPSQISFDDDGGLMELEEVEGVNVVYNNGIVSFEVDKDAPDARPPKKRRLKGPNSTNDILEGYSAFPDEPESDEEQAISDEDAPEDDGEEWTGIQDSQEAASPDDQTQTLEHWSKFDLPAPIHRALASLGFSKPTEVQQKVLLVDSNARETDDSEWAGVDVDARTRKRDVVGVAQTGSGKTLAYGLPILSAIYSARQTPQQTDSKLAALVLAPTRELALQVRKALADVAWQASNQGADKDKLVNVVGLTGGMSVEKQRRQLSRSGGPDIVVATPGRLWELISDDDDLARSIKQMRFLVIDEADRMIEAGHFRELDQILSLTRRKTEEAQTVNDFETPSSQRDLSEAREDMRTFIFSATMSKELQKNLKRHKRKIKPGRPQDNMSSLDDLLERVDFRDPDPEVIDLTTEGGLSETLVECKIECLQPEKDVHLYHFLVRYPGRTIVFLSSIDGIRRLHPILALLGLEVYIIHSGMQQRQRLKSMDRFKSSAKGILLATDVAARGLDIPSVDHVVHFQLPHSADTYIHRSGRTARAGAAGLALALVSPEEKQTYRLISAALGRSDSSSSSGVHELPVDYSILDKLKQRMDLAKEIDRETHKAQKQAHEKGWLKKTAAALEIDLDDQDDDLGSDVEEDGTGGGLSKSQKRKRRSENAKLNEMKARLDKMLKQPLMMRGVSAKYLTTRNSAGLVDQLVQGTAHDTLLGIGKTSALDALKASATNKVKNGTSKKRKV